MIREFKIGDHLKIKPNEFSRVGEIGDVFFDDSYIKHTLDDNGDIKCITCIKEYSPRQFAVFFIIAKEISIKHIKAIKIFVNTIIKDLNPKNCITYSINCDILNRWHNFFGFRLQRPSLLKQADGYNKWLIKWE